MIQRQWATIDPIFSVTSPYLSCNDPGTAPPSYIPIAAGENITAVYWYWLHPVGPMTVWLAACDATPDGQQDCATTNTTTASWFKIWEGGLLSGNVPQGIWWQKQFQNWDGSPDLWPVAVPSTLKTGLYVIRHEILSIHVANKPQFYPECAHLNVTGTGTALPPAAFYKTFPGAYEEDNPSIDIDIYSDEMMDTYVRASSLPLNKPVIKLTMSPAELHHSRWTSVGWLRGQVLPRMLTASTHPSHNHNHAHVNIASSASNEMQVPSVLINMSRLVSAPRIHRVLVCTPLITSHLLEKLRRPVKPLESSLTCNGYPPLLIALKG